MALSSTRRAQVDQALFDALAAAQFNLGVIISAASDDTLTDAGTASTAAISSAVAVSLVTAAAYTATTPSNWSGTAPTTIQAALDRCAALLFTLNSSVGP